MPRCTKPEWSTNDPGRAKTCELARLDDYECGDPSLEILARIDGRYDLIVYSGEQDLTVPYLTAGEVREAALRILALVPKTP
jgi:hypothetical protein